MKKILSILIIVAFGINYQTPFTSADEITTMNQSAPFGIGFGDTGANRDYMCQGFVPKLPTITAVAFNLQSVGTQGYLMWLDTATAANTSSPSNGGLDGVGTGIGGVREIPNAELSTSMKKYPLGHPVKVTPENYYVVCFAPWNTSTHVWATDYRDWDAHNTNPYPSKGRRVHLGEGFNEISAPDSGNGDIQFEIYGQPDGSTEILNNSIITNETIIK